MAFPNSLDNLVAPIDGVTPLNSASVSGVFNAVNVVEAVLGLNPQGLLVDVATRIGTVIGSAGGLDATSGTLSNITIVSGGADFTTSFVANPSSLGSLDNVIIGANIPQAVTCTTLNATQYVEITNGLVVVFSGTTPVNGVSLSGSVSHGGISIDGRPRIGAFGNGLVIGELTGKSGAGVNGAYPVLQIGSGLIQTGTVAANAALTASPSVSNVLDDTTGQMSVAKTLYFGNIGNQTNLFSAASGNFTTKMNGNTYVWPVSGQGIANPQPVPIGGVVLVGTPNTNQLVWATLPSFIQTVLWQKYIIQITGSNGLQPGSGYVTIYYPNGTNNKANPVPLTGTGSQTNLPLFSYSAGIITEGVKIAVLSAIEAVTGLADAAVSGANVSGGPGTITCSVGPNPGTVDKYASAYPVSTTPSSGNFQVSQDFFGEDPATVTEVVFTLGSSNFSYPLSNLNGGQFHIWVKTETTI